MRDMRDLYDRLRYGGFRDVLHDLDPKARRIGLLACAGLLLLVAAAVVRLTVLGSGEVEVNAELQAHADEAAAMLRAMEPPPAEPPAPAELPPPSRMPASAP